MKEETNEKILAMYHAVYMLLEEGSDIHKMKVADITAKAGIGKGTAYEYFRSKDELLMRALQYDFFLNCHLMETALKEQKTFRGALEAVLERVEQCSQNKRVVMQWMKLLDEIQQKDENCVREHMTKELTMIVQLLDNMAEIGRIEGCIGTEIPAKFVRMELGSQIVGYYMFLQIVERREEEKRETKDFIYESVVKSLL